ncbi:MAG TPA: hypothetical protein VNN22_07955 [Verrucomicrobiae bacterium]|nr:hypothetical protein [Verrucomicrobiae bacterium]
MRPIKTLVDRGLEIVAAKKSMEAEMEKIVAELEQHGLDHSAQHEELADADRDGKRWFANGTEVSVPMIFTADKLVGEVATKSIKRVEIEAAAGKFFRAFFKPVSGYANVFKDGKQFRKHAHELMGAEAPQFITACVARDKHGIAKSDVKILWDEAAKKKVS